MYQPGVCYQQGYPVYYYQALCSRGYSTNTFVQIFKTLPNRKSYGAEILREGSPSLPVMCQMSHVTCNVLRVMSRMSDALRCSLQNRKS